MNHSQYCFAERTGSSNTHHLPRPGVKRWSSSPAKVGHAACAARHPQSRTPTCARSRTLKGGIHAPGLSLHPLRGHLRIGARSRDMPALWRHDARGTASGWRLLAAYGCGETCGIRTADDARTRCSVVSTPQAQAIYRTRRWKRTRAYVLLRDRGQCRTCGQPATSVHHEPNITTLLALGRDPYDPAYCVSLCARCHGMAEAGKGQPWPPKDEAPKGNRFARWL